GANRQAGLEMFAERYRVDFRSCQKGKQNGAKTRQKINPGRRLKVKKVSSHYSQHNLDQRNRNAQSNGNEAGDQRGCQPDRCDDSNVVQMSPPNKLSDSLLILRESRRHKKAPDR